MFNWSTVNFMNTCVDNVYICEDENNIPKEKVPPLPPIPYPKIYPIIVPRIIRYANTSHFIIVFFDEVYA